MGASSGNKYGEAITGINVTPLVDVMLVLLIIFMVTANYVVNQSIEVELPSADTGETNVDTVNLAFVMDAESNLYLNGKPFAISQLAEEVSRLKETGKVLQALIGADKNARHGSVVALIDALRKNGITEFAINIQPQ